MKILSILLTVFSLQLSARGYSQRITLSLKNAALEKLFKLVEQQTDYKFVYTEEEMELSKPVSIDVKNESLDNVLKLSFANQMLGYSFDEKFIIIKIADKSREQIASTYIDLKGKVVDENGNAVAGITIHVKNTKKFTVSDNIGDFELKDISPNDILVISGAEMESFEVKPEGAFITITVKKKVNTLDETILIAYGSTTRRINTGSVSKITSKDISQQPISNLLSAIQGRSTGTFVQTENGLPGGNIKIQIRGQGSVASGTVPLYIIDGVPFISTPIGNSSIVNGANGPISPFSIINPSDIESIEILKDADATAIYGSRAANGVILITTKKGATGKTQVDFNLYTGIETVSRYASYLSLTDYLQIRREAFLNAGVVPTISKAPDLLVWDTTKSTNWQKYIFGNTAHVSNVQANISGGDSITRFLFGLNNRKEGTVLPGDNWYQRSGFHFNIDHTSSNKKFSALSDIIYSKDDNHIIYDASAANFVTLPPDFPIHNPDGSLNWSSISNPAALLLRKSESKGNNLIANVNLAYRILPYLTLSINGGYTKTNLDQISTLPKTAINPAFGSLSSSSFANSSGETSIIEPQINFSKFIQEGKLTIVAGGTYQESNLESESVQGSNYSNDDLLENIGAAGTLSSQSNSFTQYKYISLFSRLNYFFHNKYIINLNFRRDGSTRFGPAKEFGNFGALGVGWIFSNERVIRKHLKWLSYGKLRTSYGVTGNDQIPDYGYLSTYGAGPVYFGTSGVQPLRLANADYSWESNHKFEIALEMGFISNRILTTVTFYNNRSGNQLVPYPIPSQSGFTQYEANLPALIQNQGWEFELNSFNIKNRSFTWATSCNLTIPRNKLLKYPGLESSSFANIYVIGQDLSVVKKIHFTGVDPKTGIAQYEDVDKDNQITFPNDYQVAGKTSPDLFGGVNNSFTYRGFELNIFFQFVKQHSLGSFPYPGTTVGNMLKEAINRWKFPGDVTTVPIPIVSSNTPAYAARRNLVNSDFNFFNTSYIRLKTISFSYFIPSKILHKSGLKQCSVYIECQNLFTISGHNFIDPEVLNGTNSVMPTVKILTGGIHLTF